MDLKALAIVLFIAGIVTAMGWKIALGFIDRADLRLRVGCWFSLTVLAFVCPSFWLYVAIAVPLTLWSARRDSNPLGLYAILIFVIPPLPIPIPTGGFFNLFPLDNIRLLGLTILLPVAMRQARGYGSVSTSIPRVTGWMILAYGLVQLLELFPYESATNTMRRAVVFLLDIYLVYHAFSRGLQTKTQFDDTFASFCISAALLSALAAFESARQWLLYTQIGNTWGWSNEFAWLFRGDHLRAQASTGHALTLGYFLAVSLGFWFYLNSGKLRTKSETCVAALIAAGIYFTFSRGPILMAALLLLLYVAMVQSSMRRSILGVLVLVGAAYGFLLSPMGSGLAQTLPFIGTQDQDTVAYRQQLATVSWELIQQHPWFGDPFVLLNMEELRQGQGIIDLVNAYAGVALFNGLVGLLFFVASFGSGLWLTFQKFRSLLPESQDQLAMRRLGAVLLALMVATLFYMGIAGNTQLQWHVLSMLVAYAALPVVAARRAPQESQRHPFARGPFVPT